MYICDARLRLGNRKNITAPKTDATFPKRMADEPSVGGASIKKQTMEKEKKGKLYLSYFASVKTRSNEHTEVLHGVKVSSVKKHIEKRGQLLKKWRFVENKLNRQIRIHDNYTKNQIIMINITPHQHALELYASLYLPISRTTNYRSETIATTKKCCVEVIENNIQTLRVYNNEKNKELLYHYESMIRYINEI